MMSDLHHLLRTLLRLLNVYLVVWVLQLHFSHNHRLCFNKWSNRFGEMRTNPKKFVCPFFSFLVLSFDKQCKLLYWYIKVGSKNALFCIHPLHFVFFIFFFFLFFDVESVLKPLQ